ncbi:hypothetical protein BU15DRAFT_53979 [Melanogaster broomeanus]|nr:hypothetical protein BU15DRAFT_53979 [Melanogaster broomeanus]
MRHLPQELVIVILEHGYYTPLEVPDCAFLATCSRVCTSWCASAQSLLFRVTTKLRTPTAVAAFTSAIIAPSVCGISLGSAVRSLHINFVDCPPSWDKAAHPCCSASDIVRLLQACPRLYELALDVHSMRKFDPVVLAQFKESGQGIRSLKLVTLGMAWSILSQLLGIWPHIQFLKFDLFFEVQPPDSISDTGQEGTSVALYELSFLGRMVCTTHYPDALPWLLVSSSHSLRILRLAELPKAGTAERTMFELHAPRLRSLHLREYDMDSAVFIHQCTVLEELIVNGIPATPAPASLLPPSIEHLSATWVSWDETASHFLPEVIEVLPKLRVLTLDSLGHEQFHTLKARCVEKGIQVVPYGGYRSVLVSVRRHTSELSFISFLAGSLSRGSKMLP